MREVIELCAQAICCDLLDRMMMMINNNNNSSMLKPSSVLNLAIVTQKWHTTWIISNILVLFDEEKNQRKVNGGNDFILCLFYSKTTGTNPAFKDYS